MISSRREEIAVLFHRPLRPTLLVSAVAWLCSGCPGTGGGPSPAAHRIANGQAVLGWGGNATGEIGDGSTTQRLNPRLVALPDAKAIAAGGNASLAVTMSGRVLQWGGGTPTPTEVGDLEDVKAIAAGAGHRLALKNDGTVWAWGANDRGQLGNGSTQARSNPVNVTGLTDVLSIAAGGQHSLAIRSDLSVWAWGANNQGQLGDGTTTDRNTPAVVPGVKAIEVAASGGHSLAITDDVKVLGWGSNAECQLAVDPRNDPFDPVVCSPRLRPTELPVPQGYRAATTGRAIAASDVASFVLAANGAVVAFGGTGDPGEYRGLCSYDLALMPVALTSLTGIKEIVSGPRHTLFLKADGSLMSLGTNAAGQGGTGSTSVQNCPTEIAPARVRGATQVAAGAEHSLALVAGQSQLQPATLDFGPVQAGTSSATPLAARITNTGLGPIGFYEISKVAEEFNFTEDCPDRPSLLAPGASCEILVTFSPAAAGARAGRIVVIHDGLERQQAVALNGEGAEGSIALNPTTADFGDQTAGASSAAKQFTAQNTGGAPTVISSIAATAGFAVTNDDCPDAPAPLANGMTCTVDVVFTPSAPGAAVGELRVGYGANKQASAQLKGNGT